MILSGFGVSSMPPKDLSVYLRQLERLTELTRNMGRTENVDLTLKAIVELGSELTFSEMCSLLIYEQETDLLKFVACPPDHKERLKSIRVPVERSLAGWVYQKGKPVTLQDTGKDQHLFQQVEKEFGFTATSMAAVPMLFRGQTIGVLEAINKKQNLAYTQDDLQVMDVLSSQAAVSVLSNILFEEVKRSNDEVQSLERMKSNFIAIASHELRTPLGLILGHASYLNDIVRDKEQKAQLDVILRSANRLKGILEDLSNVNNVMAGTARLKHRLVSINQLVSKCIHSFQEEARTRKITLTSRLPDHEILIDVDEEKIEIALHNLVKNSLIFTNPGGHVLIAAEKMPGFIQMTVIDDGIGIPAKDLPLVFDRFFQVQSHLTRRHGGLGLGLSVAKAMIELHRGQIWVESIEGKGSKFYFLIPAHTTTPLRRVSAFES